jgi:hypothetical protein
VLFSLDLVNSEWLSAGIAPSRQRRLRRQVKIASNAMAFFSSQRTNKTSDRPRRAGVFFTWVGVFASAGIDERGQGEQAEFFLVPA